MIGEIYRIESIMNEGQIHNLGNSKERDVTRKTQSVTEYEF